MLLFKFTQYYVKEKLLSYYAMIEDTANNDLKDQILQFNLPNLPY